MTNHVSFEITVIIEIIQENKKITGIWSLTAW